MEGLSRCRLARTSVNQLVALTVFLALLSYAWNRDLLLKPDPAVPFRGRVPSAERGKNFFLFPSEPAFFVRVDQHEAPGGRDAVALLQQQFEQDASALQLLRRMVRIHLRSYVAAKPNEMQAIDVASPHAAWGVFVGTMGLLSHPFYPRGGADHSMETIRFNVLTQFVKTKQSLLSSNDRDILIFNKTTGMWDHGPQARSDSSITATVTLESQLRPGQQKLFMVHLGTNSKPLPGLKAVAQSLQHGFRRPRCVFADFVVGGGSGLTYDPPQPKEEQADLARTLRMLMTRNSEDFLELMALDQSGCPLSLPGANTTFLGHTVWRLTHDDVPAVAEQLVRAAGEQWAEPRVCRLLLADTPYFTAPQPPYLEMLVGVAVVLSCVVFACRRRGAQKREE